MVTQITVDPANSIWYVTTSNASTGQVYSHQQYVAGTTSIQTGTPLTSVFFENPRPAGENWGTNASCATGDSGGPIFQIIGSSGGVYTAKVFGHDYACNAGAIYQPTEKIVANYGIYPALS